MKLINSFEQPITLPASYYNDHDFKDVFVDKFLDVRDGIMEKHGEWPIVGVSANTKIWLKRLYGSEITYLETIDSTYFWGVKLIVTDMRDGLFDFYLEEAND